MKYDVFISYSRKDYVDEQMNVIPGNVVSKVKDALANAGITYWFDEEGIYSGNDFTEKIVSNIEASTIFLFLSTKDANASPWTSREVACADEMHKYILPVRIDNTPYNKKVLFRIADRSFIDYKANPEKGIAEMVESIKKYLEQEKEEEEKRLEEERIKEEQEKKKAEEIRRQKELEEKRRQQEQEDLIKSIRLTNKALNNDEKKLLIERDNLLLKAENVSDTEKRAALKKDIQGSGPISQKYQEECLGLVKEIEELNKAVRMGEDALRDKDEKIEQLEKELKDAKNQRTPFKSISQPATRRFHIVYILSILAIALVFVLWIVKERRSIHNLEEQFLADEIELAPYRQAKQEEESRQQAEEEAKRKAEEETKQQEEEKVKQQQEEVKRKAEVGAKQQADEGTVMRAEELNRLGDDYRYGRNGKTQSNEEAVRCYREAAERGYAIAQYNLGRMYEDCLGVSNINNEHVKWYRKAAEQGCEDAKKALERLRE